MSKTTLSIALALTGGLMLASCDNSQASYEDSVMEVETVEEATPAEEAAAPVVAEAVEAPVDQTPNESLPPQVQSSEESVQPESETLFY